MYIACVNLVVIYETKVLWGLMTPAITPRSKPLQHRVALSLFISLYPEAVRGAGNTDKLSTHRMIRCYKAAEGVASYSFAQGSFFTCSGDEVRVNLLLKQVSEPFDVHSYLPIEGGSC